MAISPQVDQPQPKTDSKESLLIPTGSRTSLHWRRRNKFLNDDHRTLCRSTPARRDFAAAIKVNNCDQSQKIRTIQGKSEQSEAEFLLLPSDPLLSSGSAQIEHYRRATDEELKQLVAGSEPPSVSGWQELSARTPVCKGSTLSMFSDAWEDGRDHTCPQTGRLLSVRRFLNGQGGGLSPPESNASPRISLYQLEEARA